MNKRIDSTCLKADATEIDIIKLCLDAEEYKFRGVCVPPCYVALAAEQCDCEIIAVIGYPYGYNCNTTKITEAELAAKHDATEIDVVWNLSAFKSFRHWKVLLELNTIVKAVPGLIVKVIIEENYLDDIDLRTAWKIVRDSGAQYIKTGTGLFSARLKTVKIWNNFHQDDLKIKAAGGINSLSIAEVFFEAGADVIGTSNAVDIMKEYNAFTS